jgi:hypothetical protein
MMRPGAQTPGPPLSPAQYLISAFRVTARRLALSAGAWRTRMLRLWRWVADELTDDPRHPRIGKRKRKSKTKGAWHLDRAGRP